MPRPVSPWLRKTWLPSSKVPASHTVCVTVRFPVRSAAIAMKGLKVEPGG